MLMGLSMLNTPRVPLKGKWKRGGQKQVAVTEAKKGANVGWVFSQRRKIGAFGVVFPGKRAGLRNARTF
eukprot:scaffold153594_cov15-Tisochrysis_lutea.AAC.1